MVGLRTRTQTGPDQCVHAALPIELLGQRNPCILRVREGYDCPLVLTAWVPELDRGGQADALLVQCHSHVLLLEALRNVPQPNLPIFQFIVRVSDGHDEHTHREE